MHHLIAHDWLLREAWAAMILGCLAVPWILDRDFGWIRTKHRAGAAASAAQAACWAALAVWDYRGGGAAGYPVLAALLAVLYARLAEAEYRRSRRYAGHQRPPRPRPDYPAGL